MTNENPLGPPRPTDTGRDGPRGERSNIIYRLAHRKPPSAHHDPLTRVVTGRGESGQTFFIGWRIDSPHVDFTKIERGGSVTGCNLYIEVVYSLS